jgi:hypothetical protein
MRAFPPAEAIALQRFRHRVRSRWRARRSRGRRPAFQCDSAIPPRAIPADEIDASMWVPNKAPVGVFADDARVYLTGSFDHLGPFTGSVRRRPTPSTRDLPDTRLALLRRRRARDRRRAARGGWPSSAVRSAFVNGPPRTRGSLHLKPGGVV